MVLCVRWHLKVRKLRNLEAQSWRVGAGVVGGRGEGEWPRAAASPSPFFRGKS